MKRTVDPFQYAGDFAKNMKRGVLLTTKDADHINTMTIGWGTIGILWGKPVFIAYIRKSRYTREILDRTRQFTVSAPMGEVDANILKVCGTKSGRDTDKIRELGLHLEEPDEISVPGIRELPLTLECKLLYRQEQNPSVLSSAIQSRYYPPLDDGQDYHIAYYGEIVSAYTISDSPA